MKKKESSMSKAFRIQKKMLDNVRTPWYLENPLNNQLNHIREIETTFYKADLTRHLKGIIPNLSLLHDIKTILNPYMEVAQIGRHLNNVSKGFIETEEDIKVFKAAMVNLGYPPHDGISISQMRTIAKSYVKDTQEVEDNIDEIMTTLYSPSKLKDILLSWEEIELINKRLPLLRNAVMAHNIGMYDLVVPAILSQLEGLLVDIFSIKGAVNGKIQIILLKKLLKNNEFRSAFDFDDEIYQYYTDNVLESFEHGVTNKSEVSRHAILHGADTNFGKKTVSLKVMLVFDFIVKASEDISDVQIEEAKQEVQKLRDTGKKNRRK